jgi:hypothetical protein
MYTPALETNHQHPGIMNAPAGTCAWSTGAALADSYSLIVCPPGYYKKSLAQLAGSCALRNLTCPTNEIVTGFTPLPINRTYGCMCGPCVKAGAEFSVLVGQRPVPRGDLATDTAPFAYEECTEGDELGCAAGSVFRTQVRSYTVQYLAGNRGKHA